MTLTTWHARINNIPAVLESILCQTVKPDIIVINLSYDEIIPENVNQFIQDNSIIINRMEDCKVYKKLLPTLKQFPHDVVISIDDDFLYPKEMIEEFVSIHKKHPRHPISGNSIYYEFVKCHCGCASLTKFEYFGKYIDNIDRDVVNNCASDDLVYTYFINKNGRHYISTKNEYYENMEPINPNEPYSNPNNDTNYITWNYLYSRFGKINIFISAKLFIRKIIRKVKQLSLRFANNIR